MIRPVEFSTGVTGNSTHDHEEEQTCSHVLAAGLLSVNRGTTTGVNKRNLLVGLRLLRASSIACITVVGISSRYWSLSVIGSTVPELFLTGVDGRLVSEVNMGTSTDKAGDESVGDFVIGDIVIDLEGVTDFALGVEELDDDEDDDDEDDDVFDDGDDVFDDGDDVFDDGDDDDFVDDEDDADKGVVTFPNKLALGEVISIFSNSCGDSSQKFARGVEGLDRQED
ncbi:hypothetical protein FF38_14502 [Lucilia cuprina]|uniref:Uncharacterized protein n=1 Tax=Lucilia cuprina TaxID=7375 RepID=A0A0L0CA38_LUCCU|nr:hypothetical protein FF38_14502 [Lucilia cuprina]